VLSAYTCLQTLIRALLFDTRARYLALCAVAALFKYLAASHSLVFAPASLKIKWAPLEGSMLSVALLFGTSSDRAYIMMTTTTAKQHRHRDGQDARDRPEQDQHQVESVALR
jgi:hypothetical protein